MLEIEVSWQVGPFVTYCYEAARLQDEGASEFSGAFSRGVLAGPLEASLQFCVWRVSFSCSLAPPGLVCNCREPFLGEEIRLDVAPGCGHAARCLSASWYHPAEAQRTRAVGEACSLLGDVLKQWLSHREKVGGFLYPQHFSSKLFSPEWHHGIQKFKTIASSWNPGWCGRKDLFCHQHLPGSTYLAAPAWQRLPAGHAWPSLAGA